MIKKWKIPGKQFFFYPGKQLLPVVGDVIVIIFIFLSILRVHIPFNDYLGVFLSLECLLLFGCCSVRRLKNFIFSRLKIKDDRCIYSKQASKINLFSFCNNNNNGDTEDTQDYCLVWFGCSCGFHNRHHCRCRSSFIIIK